MGACHAVATLGHSARQSHCCDGTGWEAAAGWAGLGHIWAVGHRLGMLALTGPCET